MVIWSECGLSLNRGHQAFQMRSDKYLYPSIPSSVESCDVCSNLPSELFPNDRVRILADTIVDSINSLLRLRFWLRHLSCTVLSQGADRIQSNSLAQVIQLAPTISWLRWITQIRLVGSPRDDDRTLLVLSGSYTLHFPKHSTSSYRPFTVTWMELCAVFEVLGPIYRYRW